MPVKAPMVMIPSSAILTTPLRSGQDGFHYQGKGAEINDDRHNDVNDFRGEFKKLQVKSPGCQICDEQPGKQHSDGMAQSQQRHGDAGKAFRRKHILYLNVLAGACQVQKSPCHACYGPCYDHAHDDVPFLVDARIPAGVPVKAHRLKLIAKGGLIEDNPYQQHGGNGQKDTAAHA